MNPTKPWKTVLAGPLSLALLLSAACSQNGDGTTPQSAVTLALTDAAADELSSFTVEVESFRLEKSNGAVVSVLAAPVTIDLVSLTDLSQVLNVKSVPVGLYDGATVTFDFTNAVAVLTGNSTPATLLDANGAPLTGQLTMPIQLGNGPLNALAGKHKLLELDFDLDQSLVIDSGLNTVSLEPVLVMRVDPLSPKQLFAPGSLVSVDIAAKTFLLDVKHPGGATAGTVRLVTGALTVFQIDGVPLLGLPGLNALAAKGPGTWTQVYGLIDPNSARLIALHVAAGAGTYNGGQDIVDGHVLARSSGAGSSATLTVLGHSNDASHTTFQFNTTFTVTTSFPATKVLRTGGLIPLDLDDVNVGQHVRIFGALSGVSMDASTASDLIRLQPTRAYGYAGGAPLGPTLTMSLSRVGLIPEGSFTWGDSGTTPPNPTAFTIDVAGLANGLGITTGTAVEARGYFAAVDDAGQDLGALSLANLDAAASLMFVRDVSAVGQTLIVTANPGSIALGLSGSVAAGEAALIDKGFVGALPLPTSPTPTIQPPTAGGSLYFITDKVLGSTTLYLGFTAFSNALAQAVAQGASVTQVAALGTYDGVTNVIQAPLASVCLE